MKTELIVMDILSIELLGLGTTQHKMSLGYFICLAGHALLARSFFASESQYAAQSCCPREQRIAPVDSENESCSTSVALESST